MIPKKAILFISLACIVLIGQSRERNSNTAHYDIRLTHVTCDHDCGFVQKIQTATFRDLNGVQYVRCRYADDVIDMSWSVSDIAFNYSIVNKTDTVMFIWINEIFAHDWSGKPSSFGYDMEKSPYAARMVIPARTFSSGYLIPMDNYPDKWEFETEIKPILPVSTGRMAAIRRKGAKHIGKTYEMMLPTHVGGERFVYHLTFVVEGLMAADDAEEAVPSEQVADTPLEVSNDSTAITTLVKYSHIPSAPVTSSPPCVVLASPPLPTYQALLESGISFDDPLRQLTTYAVKTDIFSHACPQEKVYLHLDNTAYFQGETIWFAATVVNASDLGEAASKVLYVELLSPTGVVLKQQKLKVVDGRCHGCLPLIDNDVEEAVALRGAIGYPSGYYQIRAYTRAMLNFDNAGVYSRVIPVYKAPDKEGEYANPVMRQYNGKETDRPESARTDKPERLNISFYPEGGHRVEGLPCRMAYKATDEHGHGVDLISLTDDQGRAIALGPQHLGMGCFMLPLSDDGSSPHSIQASAGGRTYSFRLPEAERMGCTLQLYDGGQGSLVTTIHACDLGQDTLLAYTIIHQGRVCAFDTLLLSPGTSRESAATHCLRKVQVSTDRLPTGICQFTLFNVAGAVYAQRLFFVDNVLPTSIVSVTSDKEAYRPFEQINLRLSDAPSRQYLSVAVRDAADYGTAYRDDIRTYMLLSSELKGLIEEPAWYFGDDPREERTAALDLLMMVQGWTRYNWRQMAGVEPFTVKHYTEEQLILDGWAFSRILEKPLENTLVAISLESPDGEQRQKAAVTTDSLGYWSVGLKDFEGEGALTIATRQKGRSNEARTTRMRLERASRPALYAYTPLETWLPNYAWNLDSLLAVADAEDTPYRLSSDAHVLDEVVINGRRKYIDYCTFHAFNAKADADLIYDEGKYTGKVEDYLRQKGYDVEYSTGDVGEQDFGHSSDPLRSYVRAMISAAPINNKRTFWYVHEGRKSYVSPSTVAGYALDLENVKSIIVYDSPTIYSSFQPLTDLLGADLMAAILNEKDKLCFGTGLYIVDIELNPIAKRLPVEKNSRQTTFKGYDTPVEFYAPTYPNGPIQGDKDYRRTLYWNPEVRTDSTGSATVSFYNNGYSRSLTVSAEGLTQDGVPILNE